MASSFQREKDICSAAIWARATSLVRSIADSNDYVRKKTKPTSPNSLYYSSEVEYSREHYLIPRLVRHEDFFVLQRSHNDYDEFKSSSMTFSFCNGETLLHFFKAVYQESKLIPQKLAWHLLNQGLQVLDFLHDGYPSATHNDVHPENIFLHFTDDKQKLPNFYLGDFGLAYVQSPSIWEIHQNPARSGLNSRVSWYGSQASSVTLTGLKLSMNSVASLRTFASN